MSELVNKVGSTEQDNLIARAFPRALTMGVKIAAGEGALKRGTILTRKADSTFAVYGKSDAEEGSEPSAILTDDIDASGGDPVAAVAYCSGNFNPDAVIMAEDHKLTAAEKDTLRKYDILFTQMFED